MHTDLNGTRSLWTDTVPHLTFDSLREGVKTDVCIVGGGISGITTGYLLTRAGLKVAILEAGAIGSGETGRTTAHLSYILRSRYQDLISLHGIKGARLIAESHSYAIDTIEEIVRHGKIDCDYQRVSGYLFAPYSDSPEVLTKEQEALETLGFSGLELTKNLPFSSLSVAACLHIPDQAQFHPLKYLHSLTSAIIADGGSIYTESRAARFDKVGDNHVVTTSGGATVTSRHLVVATNTPMHDRFVIHTKQAAYRTYAIGVNIPRGSAPTALFWDTLDPYHYIRVAPGCPSSESDTLIVGGEDHKTGQEADPRARFDALEEWVKQELNLLPEVVYRWSGQVMESVDGIGYMGRNPGDNDSSYIITGDCGNGMTNGTIGALIVTDLILGRDNPWEDLYNPSRVSPRAVKCFLSENLNTAAQYRDWFKGAEVESPDDIAKGSGAILVRGLQKIAAYRDHDGVLHQLSAVCPHLGGIVRWNDEERSWDCPCHGSRFGPLGDIRNGPALSPLSRIKSS